MERVLKIQLSVSALLNHVRCCLPSGYQVPTCRVRHWWYSAVFRGSAQSSAIFHRAACAWVSLSGSPAHLSLARITYVWLNHHGPPVITVQSKGLVAGHPISLSVQSGYGNNGICKLGIVWNIFEYCRTWWDVGGRIILEHTSIL